MRGPEPDWYQDAVNVNAGNTNMSWTISKMRIEALKIHASETAWVGTNFDAVIDNNSTMDNLYIQVKNLVQDRQQPR